MRTVTITLTDDMEQQLQRIADLRGDGASLETVIVDVLHQYLGFMLSRADSDREPASAQHFFTPLQEKDEFGEPDAGINHDQYLAETFEARRRSDRGIDDKHV